MHLHLVSTQSRVQAGKSIECDELVTPDEHKEYDTTDLCESQMEKRRARIEALRRQVRAGTYQVDSYELAECLLRKRIN